MLLKLSTAISSSMEGLQGPIPLLGEQFVIYLLIQPGTQSPPCRTASASGSLNQANMSKGILVYSNLAANHGLGTRWGQSSENTVSIVLGLHANALDSPDGRRVIAFDPHLREILLFQRAFEGHNVKSRQVSYHQLAEA